MTTAQLLSDLGIDLKHKQSGHIDTICPQCSKDRKHKSNKCLSVEIDEGLYRCHHCSWSGRVLIPKVKEYVRPLPRLEKLGAKALEFFEQKRGISNNTLLRFNVTEAIEWMPQFERNVTVMCFNYYRGDTLLNIKFRGPEKSFKLAKDAELVFYNLNALEGQDTAIIVEGEIDCLAMHESGVYNSVSTPNGAPPIPKDRPYKPQLEYLDNCWQDFQNIKKVIIATDDDDPGRALRDELARRIGKEKCLQVHFPEGCKDTNEVLIKYGKEAVKAMVSNATDWPLEGIEPMEGIAQDVVDFYEHGYPLGFPAHIAGFDDLLTFFPGHLTMITGIPGHGKDEWTNLVMSNLSKNEGWKWGVFNFEEPANIHTTKLIEKFTEKAFAFRKDKSKRMSQDQMEQGVLFVDQFFTFVNVGEVDCTMAGIVAKAEELVKRKGIRGLIINPWNYLEHRIAPGQSETTYVSEALTTLVNFLWKYGVHCFLVAHPTKIQKDKKSGKYEIPNLYSISGSSHFFNKTHNGITVYRNYDDGTTDIYVQKVKWYWLGQVGFSTYWFDTETRKYLFQSSSIITKSEIIPDKLYDETEN